MLAGPSISLDLPFKILVREDSEGRVWISYNSATYLQTRHGLPEKFAQSLAVVDAIAEQAGE
jgi:uncharacterized protein (DUF302 family)